MLLTKSSVQFDVKLVSQSITNGCLVGIHPFQFSYLNHFVYIIFSIVYLVHFIYIVYCIGCMLMEWWFLLNVFFWVIYEIFLVWYFYAQKLLCYENDYNFLLKLYVIIQLTPNSDFVNIFNFNKKNHLCLKWVEFHLELIQTTCNLFQVVLWYVSWWSWNYDYVRIENI